METKGVCELLEWDSNFFGFPVGRVTGDKLSPSKAVEIDAWCRENKIRCLYFLARSDHPETTTIAENHGFRFVDIRMTLVHRLSDVLMRERTIPDGVVIRAPKPGDLPVFRQISSQSYHASRFYYDSNFPTNISDSLYAIWIEKSLKGDADRVFVIAQDDAPIGFIVCRLESEIARGHIDLVGINPEQRGLGLGKTLVLTALEWFRTQCIDEVLVVTQGRNILAQRLYQGCGFRTMDVQLWYHKWYQS